MQFPFPMWFAASSIYIGYSAIFGVVGYRMARIETMPDPVWFGMKAGLKWPILANQAFLCGVATEIRTDILLEKAAHKKESKN